jgi:GNAT superfamily N-acetyltransferase
MIRQFRPEDAAGCIDVVRACIRFDRCLAPDLRDLLLEAETAASLCERAARHYLAVDESGDRITGVGGVELNEIRILYVDPGRQGAGIGSALLGHLEELVPSALFRDVFVYAIPSAEGFYRARGYAARGVHAFQAGGAVIKTVFMVKDLRPARP